MKVSVVIPCFNHGAFLAEAVNSALDAKRDDVELIVVDDGSTDERTRNEMDDLRARGIHVIQQENRGLASARNAGIAASYAQYIFPLDADDRMRAAWIDRAIQILDSDPKVGIVYGDAECFGTSAFRWCAGPFDPFRILASNTIHASALYRRSVWEQNGGYDGAMPVQGFEDWDFWLGALERGWEFAYVPEVFFEYRQAADSMISRALDRRVEVYRFIATKHAVLYREFLVRLQHEHEQLRQEHERLKQEQRSVRKACRNLARLLRSRLGQNARSGKAHRV